MNTVILSQEQKIVKLEERNHELENCEDWFLKWNYGKEAKQREDELNDELRSLRICNQMAKADFESSVVNSEWQFQRRAKSEIDRVKELSQDLSELKTSYAKQKMAIENLEEQLDNSRKICANLTTELADKNERFTESIASITRLNEKVEEQLKKEFSMRDIIDSRDREILSIVEHDAIIVAGLKEEIKSLINEGVLAGTEIDKLRSDDRKKTKEIVELTELCRDPTPREVRERVSSILRLFPFYLRKCAEHVLTKEIQERAIKLDLHNVEILRSVASLMKPACRLKSVAICVLTVVRLSRAMKSKDFSRLGEFGRMKKIQANTRVIRNLNDQIKAAENSLKVSKSETKSLKEQLDKAVDEISYLQKARSADELEFLKLKQVIEETNRALLDEQEERKALTKQIDELLSENRKISNNFENATCDSNFNRTQCQLQRTLAADLIRSLNFLRLRMAPICRNHVSDFLTITEEEEAGLVKLQPVKPKKKNLQKNLEIENPSEEDAKFMARKKSLMLVFKNLVKRLMILSSETRTLSYKLAPLGGKKASLKVRKLNLSQVYTEERSTVLAAISTTFTEFDGLVARLQEMLRERAYFLRVIDARNNEVTKLQKSIEEKKQRERERRAAKDGKKAEKAQRKEEKKEQKELKQQKSFWGVLKQKGTVIPQVKSSVWNKMDLNDPKKLEKRAEKEAKRVEKEAKRAEKEAKRAEKKMHKHHIHSSASIPITEQDLVVSDVDGRNGDAKRLSGGGMKSIHGGGTEHVNGGSSENVDGGSTEHVHEDNDLHPLLATGDKDAQILAQRVISILGGNSLGDESDSYDSEYDSDSSSDSEESESDEENQDEMAHIMKLLMEDDIELVKAECDAQWNYRYRDLQEVKDDMAKRIEEMNENLAEMTTLLYSRNKEIIELSQNVEELANSYRVIIYL
jgi:hypothetical protein